jgi:AcrR family transcriptional regulator
VTDVVSPRARHDDAEILAATIRVIADDGVSGATVDTVAARAGVSKATIYRHWGSRARLIHAALSSLEGPYAAVEGDSLREDLSGLLGQVVEYFNRPDIGRVFASFIDAAARDPELAELHQLTMAKARTSFELVVRRGIARGELPDDLDVDLFIDVVRAPFIYRRVVAQQSVRPADIEPVIDLVLGAFSRVPN